jgi:hypothetical protein
LATGKAILVFVIPIAFSFIYGGAVLALSLQNPDRSYVAVSPDASGPMQITDLQAQYFTSDQISASVSVGDPKFDCGDLYMTIYDVSTGQRKAVKQGAFFDQCYGSSGVLPTRDGFSERIDVPGKYLLEAQLFDKNGDEFLTTSQQFTVQ